MTIPVGLSLGDTAMSIHRFPGATSAVTRSTRDKLAEALSVKDFGAIGDGGSHPLSGIFPTLELAQVRYPFATALTDEIDWAAWQAAFNHAVANSKSVRAPSGTYSINRELRLDLSGSSSEDGSRPFIIGDGHANTALKWTGGNGNCINIIGPDNPANGSIHAFWGISGLRLVSSGKQGVGIRGTNIAYWRCEDLLVMRFETGLILTDFLSSSFDNVQVRENKYGLFADRNYTASNPSDYESSPNNIAFHSCIFSANSQYALHVISGSEINFFGGSIENNGLSGQGGTGTRWAVKLDNAGVEGAVGGNFYGVYFEHNDGVADVWIDQGDPRTDTSQAPRGFGSAYNFFGCTFNRNSATEFSQFNIYFNTGVNPGALGVYGCGFLGAGAYVPSAARPCIQLPTTARGWKAHQSGNFFSHDIDAPLWTDTPTFTVLLDNDQNINNDTAALVGFRKVATAGNVIGEDYGNCWNDATHAFIAPYNVRMNFSVQVFWSGTLVSGNYVRVELRVNDAPVRTFAMAATGAMPCPINCDINLRKNDAVQVIAYVNSGGAGRTIFSGPQSTYFTGRPA